MDEYVKLYWIDTPYKFENKWVIDAYFKSNTTVEKIMLDWASTHFLAFGRYYSNGNLNSVQNNKNELVIDLNLNNIDFRLTQDYLNINSKEIRTDIFVGYKNGKEYRIPALEIIRAVIATNRFLLNRIVELDSLTKYFVFRFDKDRNLYIDFFDEYERKLLESSYIKHLAWIITNENILKMFNQIGKNIWLCGNISYDFLFENLQIKARIHEEKNIIRIFEIIEVKNKIINAKEIYISSKYINKLNISNHPKSRRYKNLNITDDKTLDSKIDGAKNQQSDFIDTLNTKHSYINNIKINGKKKNIRPLRIKEDENTNVYEIENNNLRTSADIGGIYRLKGIEYKNIENISVKGELQEFIEIMKLLQKKKKLTIYKL
ncbi:hypothetical protein KQI42_03660 [Tissierella sp. MSJ-40]|uniref:Uncharacterized protein n=1 Tax=Tissierella simiarum TaxID=2841534 RepID=A0ABS6E3D3_9FIRM|nr:hypothetical protein [Tissierella simiarum]MBU5437091.1 hypothetical protein [Tissierella simiarum]